MPHYPHFHRSVEAVLRSHPDRRCYAYLKLYKKTKDFLVCLQGLSKDTLIVRDRMSDVKRIPLEEVQWIQDADQTGGAK